MSKQYQIKLFLRQTSNRLLKEYFNSRNITLKFDFENSKETKIDELFEEIISLDRVTQDKINAEFSRINNLCAEPATKTIIQEAKYNSLDLVEQFESLKGAYDKALWIFLNQDKIFQEAETFVNLSNLPTRFFRKIQNMQNLLNVGYSTKISELESAISFYFKNKEGRGTSCEIDFFERNALKYFFCYPEDYSKNELSWKLKQLELIPVNPAFEIIFIYDEAKQTLDSYFQGDKKTDEELKCIFSNLFLGFDKLPEKKR